MALLLFEAFLALAILGLIVWWTMFSGRDRGEPVSSDVLIESLEKQNHKKPTNEVVDD